MPSAPDAKPVPPPRSRVRKLGDMLVGQGIISPAQLQEVLDLQKARKVRIGRLLVELGYVTEAQLAELVADQLRIPCVDIEMVTVTPEAQRVVSMELAVQHRCLPWRIEAANCIC